MDWGLLVFYVGSFVIVGGVGRALGAKQLWNLGSVVGEARHAFGAIELFCDDWDAGAGVGFLRRKPPSGSLSRRERL